MHIAHLARAENELLASPLEDKLRFVFREHVRGAVVLLRQLLLPLHHFARKANDHVVFIGLSVNRDGSECRAFDLHSLTLVLFPILRDTLNGIALTAPAPFVDEREGSPVASVAVFFFCFMGEVRGNLECDKFPRARTPFERALYVQTTPFASVGDILEAVGEEDRRISLLQFGQISIVGTTEHASLVLMMFPFARRNVGASEEAHPGVGACQSEKQELRTGPVALRQRLDREHCAPIICKSREKMTAAVRACRRAGTRLQLLAFRSRSPRPGRLPWCLKAWRTVHRSCL